MCYHVCVIMYVCIYFGFDIEGKKEKKESESESGGGTEVQK